MKERIMAASSKKAGQQTCSITWPHYKQSSSSLEQQTAKYLSIFTEPRYVYAQIEVGCDHHTNTITTVTLLVIWCWLKQSYAMGVVVCTRIMCITNYTVKCVVEKWVKLFMVSDRFTWCQWTLTFCYPMVFCPPLWCVTYTYLHWCCHAYPSSSGFCLTRFFAVSLICVFFDLCIDSQMCPMIMQLGQELAY